jgi:ankyrin repeat protein
MVLLKEKAMTQPTDKEIDEYLFALADGKKDKVLEFLENYPHTLDQQLRGVAALPWAAFNGKKDMVELLLAWNANINAINDNGDTALMVAADCGTDRDDIAKLLLDKGADVTLKNNAGKTAEEIAVDMDKWDMAIMIVEKLGLLENEKALAVFKEGLPYPIPLPKRLNLKRRPS